MPNGQTPSFQPDHRPRRFHVNPLMPLPASTPRWFLIGLSSAATPAPPRYPLQRGGHRRRNTGAHHRHQRQRQSCEASLHDCHHLRHGHRHRFRRSPATGPPLTGLMGERVDPHMYKPTRNDQKKLLGSRHHLLLGPDARGSHERHIHRRAGRSAASRSMPSPSRSVPRLSPASHPSSRVTGILTSGWTSLPGANASRSSLPPWHDFGLRGPCRHRLQQETRRAPTRPSCARWTNTSA